MTRDTNHASPRQRWGCWLHERWRTEMVLRTPRLARFLGWQWLDLCNRNERLQRDRAAIGRVCDWYGSSELTVSRIFPGMGSRLLRHCLREWPIAVSHRMPEQGGETPLVSFIVPVCGVDRLPLFQTTLASLLGQRHSRFEIVVVESGEAGNYRTSLPEGVTYVPSPVPAGEVDFNKCRLLNAGARAARGEWLVFHDADLVAPADYGATIERLGGLGLHAFRPVRWIFYLSQGCSGDWRACRDRAGTFADPPMGDVERVVQNCPMPCVIRRDQYWNIGGHDESFVGWGGEDDEFWDRAATLTASKAGCLPLLHLWHPPASRKVGDRNRSHFQQKMAIPARERIDQLRSRLSRATEVASEYASSRPGYDNP